MKRQLVQPLTVLALILSTSLCHRCGNSHRSNNRSGFAPINVIGKYEVQSSSSALPGSLPILELNIASQSSDTEFAAPSTLIFVADVTDPANIDRMDLIGIDTECDSNQLGDDSATVNSSSATEAAYSFSNNDLPGSIPATGSVGSSFTGTFHSGDYPFPSACGQPADPGTQVGAEISPFSRLYSSLLNGDAISALACRKCLQMQANNWSQDSPQQVLIKLLPSRTMSLLEVALGLTPFQTSKNLQGAGICHYMPFLKEGFLGSAIRPQCLSFVLQLF